MRFGREFWYEESGWTLLDVSEVTITGLLQIGGGEVYDTQCVGGLQTGDYIITPDGSSVEITGIDRYNYCGSLWHVSVSGLDYAFRCPKGLNLLTIDDVYVDTGAGRQLGASGDVSILSLNRHDADSLPESGGLFYVHSSSYLESGQFYRPTATKIEYGSSGYIFPITSVVDGGMRGMYSASRVYTSGGAPFILDGFAVSGG